MNCPNCGQVNPEGATQCSNCGQVFVPGGGAAPPAPPAAPQYAPPPPPPQYVAPPAPGGYAAAPVPTGPMPPNYLWQSILVTVLCCWPLGIPAIIFAAQVSAKYNQGDYAGALAASGKAKTWTIVALVSGLVGGILYGALTILGAVASSI